MKDLRELPLVLTVDEVAVVLRISRGAAYEAIRRGEIPVLHLGRTIRVARSTMAHLLQDRSDDSSVPRPSTIEAVARDT